MEKTDLAASCRQAGLFSEQSPPWRKNIPSCVFEIIHQTQLSSNTFSVKELCQVAGVSRSGYYAWLKAAPIRELQEQQDRKNFDLILTAYKMHGFTKGAKGIYMALLHMNPPVIMNLKKIRRLMDSLLSRQSVRWYLR